MGVTLFIALAIVINAEIVVMAARAPDGCGFAAKIDCLNLEDTTSAVHTDVHTRYDII